MNFYDLSAKSASGKEIPLSNFKGKVVLVVNTATKCGLTPQFSGLEKLHQVYKDKGLVVIGFPCNQFAGQEPESNESMVSTCAINHGVTFQLTEKIDVNGKNTHPVFAYLKKELPGFPGNSIKWNFTKFLISSDGKPLKRYSPRTKPQSIEKDIIKAIGE